MPPLTLSVHAQGGWSPCVKVQDQTGAGSDRENIESKFMNSSPTYILIPPADCLVVSVLL